MKTSLDPEEMVHSLASINVAVTVAKEQKTLLPAVTTDAFSLL